MLKFCKYSVIVSRIISTLLSQFMNSTTENTDDLPTYSGSGTLCPSGVFSVLVLSTESNVPNVGFTATVQHCMRFRD